VWAKRYDVINAFEQELADDGLTMVKVMLHISREEQRERLLARLDDPTKRWKYNPATSLSGPAGRTTSRRTKTR
jgi:polyphosphate kinase 2 (PPK2 family)